MDGDSMNRDHELRSMAAAALKTADVDTKLQQTRAMRRAWQQGALRLDRESDGEALAQPGRPDRPEMVRAKHVPRRGFGTVEGRAIMMHAIAHIEFNAINLALDAIQRFAGMPEAYYSDWLQVAAEEAYHFELIRAHLRHLGGEYGDHPAHGGLWEMCEKTGHDIVARMALVPRVLEARGLDVTPGIQEKLAQAGDHHAVSILDIILRDEIGHVAIGNRWFHYCCRQCGCEPLARFRELLAIYYPKGLSGPFNLDARAEAGFSAAELGLLCNNESSS